MQTCPKCQAKFDKPDYQYCSGWCKRHHEKEEAKKAFNEALCSLPPRQRLTILASMLDMGKL